MRGAMRHHLYIVVAALVAVYVTINYVLPQLPIDGMVKSYVIQPAIWVLLAVLVLRLPRQRPVARRRDRSTVLQLALLIGITQIVITVVGGLFSGFGRSPYAFTPAAVVRNMVFASSMLVGIELARAWLVGHLGKRHAVLAITISTVLFAGFTFSADRLLDLNADIQSVQFLGDTVLPTLAVSLLASYLALLGGWRASLAYRGVLEAFWWLCPVLPDLSWAFEALIGTAVPVVGMVVVNSVVAGAVSSRRRRREENEGSLGSWIATGVVAVVAIWFAVGLFPVKPALVASGSMRPALDVGDIAIVAETPTWRIQQGDIIEYRSVEQPSIIHRVVEVQHVQDRTMFVTKGDANDTVDFEPVLAENVVGIHVYTIRHVGWISVGLKELFVNRSG